MCLALLFALTLSPAHSQNVIWKSFYLFPQDHNIWDIDCADSLHCMAVASLYGSSESMILKTTDGGRTWTKVDSIVSMPGRPRIPTYVRVVYPTPNVAVVGTDSGAVLRTTNSGASWERTPVVRKGAFDWISMPDERNILAGVRASPNWLAASTDGGVTWDSISSPIVETGMAIADVALLKPNTFVCLLVWHPQNAIIRSDDRGKTWSIYRNVLPDSSGGRMVFIDSLTGWVGSSVRTGVRDRQRSVISKTTDGGVTWTTLLDEEVGSNYPLTDIDFMDADTGLAVGGVGTVIRTKDGGKTWKLEPSDMKGLEKLWIVYPKGSRGIIATTFGRVGLPYDDVSEVAIDVSGMKGTCMIYPNPVTRGSRATIRYRSEEDGRLRVHLSNALGEEVCAIPSVVVQRGEHAMPVDLSELFPGTYFLQVVTENRTITTMLQIVE